MRVDSEPEDDDVFHNLMIDESKMTLVMLDRFNFSALNQKAKVSL